MLLQWHVTERCNLRCSHCYQEGQLPAELPFASLLGIVEQFKELLDRERMTGGQITVTGGEPFVRADFPDLLDALSRERPRLGFAVLTNGTRIDRAMARRLRAWRPQFVQVSVDGMREAHDAVRGAGNFDRACEAVRTLASEGVPAYLSFTAHRGNFREFSSVARLGGRLGATRVWSDRLIPMGGGAGMETLTPAETREYVGVLATAAKRERRRWFHRTEVACHRALQFLGGGDPYRCAAGRTLLTVGANGDVVPCRRMPIRVGNVLETPLADLYREGPLLQQLRDPDRVARGCERCPHERQCRGGLRCLAYAVTGDPFHADPGCWLARTQPESR
jgi:radical SAM protein with 4Fe4S-binding SPASM domain